MTNRDILLQEGELERLITSYEKKIEEISNNFDEIKTKTAIINGDSEIWRSKAQQELKIRKDNYVNQFDRIINEQKKQLELLKEAKMKLKEAEQNITNNIDYQINDII